MRKIKLFLYLGLFTLFINSAAFAQATGSVRGQVVDSLGASVVGATVTAVDGGGKEKSSVTNSQGEFTISGLAPGNYTVRAAAPNFGVYENTEVAVAAGQREELTIALTVEAVAENVEVSGSNQVSTDSDNNAGATVLNEKDLEALPDDPDELEAALQALAGPSAGPNGGQIYIDGFTGGRLPPRDSIREIRINSNIFSAEYERIGFGRIEVLTKPGSDRFRGQAFFNFNDESLNSRNPFSVSRAATQVKFYGFNLSGPVQKGKSSFFLDLSNQQIDNSATVNALVLDSAANVVSFQQEFPQPRTRFNFNPRFDYQINENNTLVARYSFNRFANDNLGISEFSLPTRIYEGEGTEHEIRLTETMIVNPKTINETRFEYEFNRSAQFGDNTIPTISVAAAFTGGGAQIGDNFNRSNYFELQNYTTTTLGAASQHTLKFGVRIRNNSITDQSENNFGGTFIFPGTLGFSPILQYQQNVLGNNAAQFNPSQFTITTGNALANVSRFDVGGFVTDDWRFSPKLTLGFGLRYENQNNISDNLNFAPRLNFAYSPGAGGARAPQTVIRGGFGIFYDRFGENFTLESRRFDGINQLNLIVSANETDPTRRAAAIALLSQPVFSVSGVTNVPTAAQILAALPQSNTITRVASDLRSPYIIQTAVGIERQLPYRTSVSAFYIAQRNLHVLRRRNVNAPICPDSVNCSGAPRPDPSQSNIYQYESSGIQNQQQLILTTRTTFNQNFSMQAFYRLGFANGDTDGARNFPAYSYDLEGEYGRSAFDVRHNFNLIGSVTMPWRVTMSPQITISSGAPFNIVTGVDTNGDTQFTERPTYAALNAACVRRGLTNSFCDIGGISNPNAIIPRNYGNGPSFFVANLRLNKTFGFGGARNSTVATTTSDSPRPGGGGGIPGGGGGPGGGGRGGFGGGFGGNENSPYNLSVGLQFFNLFNNVNFNTPIGNLNSTRFGQSTSTTGGFGGFGGGGGGGGGFGGNSGNRRIVAQLRFSW